MPVCTRCGEDKPVEAFALHTKSDPTSRRRSACRQCANAQDRQRRAAPGEKDKRREYNRQRYDRESQVARVYAWRAANPETAKRIQRNAQARRRARLRGVANEHIDYLELFERDGGRCGICHLKVTLDDGSIDHVIPLSHGGDHTYTNVQLAHKSCNYAKGNRTVPTGEQLRLIG